jgi:hypothetical protein
MAITQLKPKVAAVLHAIATFVVSGHLCFSKTFWANLIRLGQLIADPVNGTATYLHELDADLSGSVDWSFDRSTSDTSAWMPCIYHDNGIEQGWDPTNGNTIPSTVFAQIVWVVLSVLWTAAYVYLCVAGLRNPFGTPRDGACKFCLAVIDSLDGCVCCLCGPMRPCLSVRGSLERAPRMPAPVTMATRESIEVETCRRQRQLRKRRWWRRRDSWLLNTILSMPRHMRLLRN